MIDLITARKGIPHVTPKNDASIWRSLVGIESGVFSYGANMEVEVSGTNFLIRNGIGMIQGRMFQTDGNDIVPIQLPSTGRRYAVLCLKVTDNDGVQDASWEVIYGNTVPSSQQPIMPVVPSGNLDDGETSYLALQVALCTASGVTSQTSRVQIINGFNRVRYKSYKHIWGEMGSGTDTAIAHGLPAISNIWQKYEIVSAYLVKDSDQTIVYSLPYNDYSHPSYAIGYKADETNIHVITGTSWAGYSAHFTIGEVNNA